MSDNFDRLLVRAERRDRHVRGTCPDAAVLAAYLDGTLASGDRATLEAHAADCSRCALQLATIVRLEDEARESRPAPAPARCGGVSCGRCRLPRPRSRPSSTSPRLRARSCPAPARDARSAPPAQAPMSRPEAPPSEEAGSSPQVLADQARNEARADAPSEKVQTKPAARLQRAAGRLAEKGGVCGTAASVGTPAPIRQPHRPRRASPAVPEASERWRGRMLTRRARRRPTRVRRPPMRWPPRRPLRLPAGVAREGSPLVAVGERVAQAAALVVHAPDSRVRWRVSEFPHRAQRGWRAHVGRGAITDRPGLDDGRGAVGRRLLARIPSRTGAPTCGDRCVDGCLARTAHRHRGAHGSHRSLRRDRQP